MELLLAVTHKFKVHSFCSFTVTQIQPSILVFSFPDYYVSCIQM